MFSQNNMFNGYTKGKALIMGGDNKNPACDDKSYFSTALNGTPTKINFTSKRIVLGIQIKLIMDINYLIHIIQAIMI